MGIGEIISETRFAPRRGPKHCQHKYGRPTRKTNVGLGDGEFGEAAILTLVIEAKQKNQILEDLAKNLGLNEKDQGLVFEETALLKCS